MSQQSYLLWDEEAQTIVTVGVCNDFGMEASSMRFTYRY